MAMPERPVSPAAIEPLLHGDTVYATAQKYKSITTQGRLHKPAWRQSVPQPQHLAAHVEPGLAVETLQTLKLCQT